MPSLFDPHWRFYYLKVAIAFLIWAGLWAWLIYSRPERLRWRTALIVVAGYVAMTAMAVHYVQYILHFHDRDRAAKQYRRNADADLDITARRASAIRQHDLAKLIRSGTVSRKAGCACR